MQVAGAEVAKLQNCPIAHIDALVPTGRDMVAQGVARSASPGYRMPHHNQALKGRNTVRSRGLNRRDIFMIMIA